MWSLSNLDQTNYLAAGELLRSDVDRLSWIGPIRDPGSYGSDLWYFQDGNTIRSVSSKLATIRSDPAIHLEVMTYQWR